MQHSASSITLARRCPRAWWHRYRDKLKPPEYTWLQIVRLEKSGKKLPPGAKSLALGKEVHARAEVYLVKGAKRVQWNDLPGQVLQALVPLLPPAGSVRREDVERRISVKVDGVSFRGLIDVVLASEVWDHKTTRDIREYALLPHALAVRLGQPKRSLRDDLQACMYTLAKGATLARWNYTETQQSRRSLPVVQHIPLAHARTVIQGAAVDARSVEAYTSAEDATPNTVACGDYGGCWYRAEGHCTVPRKWGLVIMHVCREAEEKKAMGKQMRFKQLTEATEEANEVEERAAKKATRKRAPEPEEVDEEEQEEEEEAPESEPAPKPKKRRSVTVEYEAVEEDDDAPESEPAPKPKAKPASARAAAQKAFDKAVPMQGAAEQEALSAARVNLMTAFGDFLHAITNAAGAR